MTTNAKLITVSFLAVLFFMGIFIRMIQENDKKATEKIDVNSFSINLENAKHGHKKV